MTISVCVWERALFVKWKYKYASQTCLQRRQIVVHQERAHPDRGRWKEEKQVSRVRALFSVFGQVEKGRDVGGKFVGDRRFT